MFISTLKFFDVLFHEFGICIILSGMTTLTEANPSLFPSFLLSDFMLCNFFMMRKTLIYA